MEYGISFLEGIITFISPCLLPMLPIYLSYFAGSREVSEKGRRVFGALWFCAGFTVVFVAMGAFAGGLGGLLVRHQRLVNLLTGGVVVWFGLHFLGLFELSLFRGTRFSAPKGYSPGQGFLLGVVFSIGWTPCVGAFLGSALMLASQQGSMVKGVLMLLCYALGLGVPFIMSAVLLEQLQGAFGWIKRHYGIINRVCGSLLVVMGVLMMTGHLGALLLRLSI